MRKPLLPWVHGVLKSSLVCPPQHPGGILAFWLCRHHGTAWNLHLQPIWAGSASGCLAASLPPPRGFSSSALAQHVHPEATDRLQASPLPKLSCVRPNACSELSFRAASVTPVAELFLRHPADSVSPTHWSPVTIACPDLCAVPN